MSGCDRCGSLNCCQHEWREDLATKDAEIAALREALEIADDCAASLGIVIACARQEVTIRDSVAAMDQGWASFSKWCDSGRKALEAGR